MKLAEEIRDEKRLETYRGLVRKASEALQNSYAPYSKFHVGAALLCADGSVICGVNVENASYSAGICAERSAMVQAVSRGKTEFSAIAIVGCREEWLQTPEYRAGKLPQFCQPCGICRQFMSEFAKPEEFSVILARSEEDLRVYTLGELLPAGFDPTQL